MKFIKFFVKNMLALLVNKPRCLSWRFYNYLYVKFRKPQGDIWLIVPFYHEANQARLREYEECFRRNIKNQLINEIHVLYENREGPIDRFLNHPKVHIHDYRSKENRFIKFKDCINHANRFLKGTIIVIANADIYFDYSLHKVIHYDLKDKVFALTRWDCGAYKKKTGAYWSRHEQSQDCWIFKTPIKKFHSDIIIGWKGCDRRVAFEMVKSGLTVENPSKTIRIWHIHATLKRNYIEQNHDYDGNHLFRGQFLSVPISKLK